MAFMRVMLDHRIGKCHTRGYALIRNTNVPYDELVEVQADTTYINGRSIRVPRDPDDMERLIKMLREAVHGPLSTLAYEAADRREEL